MEGLDLGAFILESLAFLPGLLVGFTVHELAHALVAYALGDRGEHTRVRLTLNPLRHVSWLGLAAFMVIRIGWAKPVRFDPRSFKHPNLDSFLVAIAGVTANILVGLVWGLVCLVLLLIAATVLVLSGFSETQIQLWLLSSDARPWVILISAFTVNVLWVNLVLAGFNLLPLPGLDGFHALMRLALMVRGLFRPGQPLPWLPEASPPAAGAPAEPEPAIPVETDPMQQAQTYQRTGLLREAVTAYREALARDRANLEANRGLAQSYRMLGERRQAIAALGAALAQPLDPAARESVLAAMRDLGWQTGDPVPALEPPL
ncbi:MAG: site-2 protease family protein [Chloroflexi bacterium]|nr:site-2 protease family protein [Chloroflexota bacterium]MBU1747197.1 site-2 protease family protein [Chloroflexota bacterium]